MPKYHFSQGQITIEDGLYNPMLERKQNASQANVLIILKRTRPDGIRLKEQYPTLFSSQERKDHDK